MPAALQLVVEDGGGHRQVVPFAAEEIAVGRSADNAVRLPERDVSRRHALFQRVNGAVYLEDLGSANGTRVNGERLQGRRRVRQGDLVQIGGYDLVVEGFEERARPTAEMPVVVLDRSAPPPLPAAAPAAAEPDPAPRGGGLLRRATALLAIGACALALGYAAGRLRLPPAAAGTAQRP